MLPTWLPNTALKLGDVGVVEARVFRRVTNLKSLHIAFETMPLGPAADLNAVSSSGAKIETKAAVSGLPAAAGLGGVDAGIVVEFQEEGGFVFQAAGCYQRTIKDRATLSEDILAAYETREWHPEWVVIDSLMHAACVTVLVSDSSNSRLELSTGGNVLPDSVPLAKADASFAMVSQSGSITRIVGARDATPLFHASRVRASFFPLFSSPSLGAIKRVDEVSELTHRAPEDDGARDADALEALSIEDYMTE